MNSFYIDRERWSISFATRFLHTAWVPQGLGYTRSVALVGGASFWRSPGGLFVWDQV
jgi:hypothetical protein